MIPEQLLTLDKGYLIPQKKPKRKAGEPDMSTLNDGQKKAAEVLMEYIKGGDNSKSMYLLEGYAGTGKTYLVTKLLEWCVSTMKIAIAVTAPTNKAVRVLREQSEIEHADIHFKTIHSLLGLIEQTDMITGKQYFAPSRNLLLSDKNLINQIDVLFIDETSMLNDELFHMVLPFLNNGLKIIFIGDPAQIPPINSPDCLPFIENARNKYKIGHLKLAKIVRQAEDNPILSLATFVRNNYHNQIMNFSLSSVITTNVLDRSGLVSIKSDEKNLIKQISDIYFANDYFNKYPDFMKIIAWRNATVNNLNKSIRKLVFKKDDLPALLPGDKMIADKPYILKIGRRTEIFMNGNDEFTIHDYTIDKMIIKGISLTFYNASVRMFGGEQIAPFKVRIVHENSAVNYTDLMNRISNEAKQETDYSARGALWAQFFEVRDSFCQAKYNYAITGHKAQGSTYENCMVVLPDIMANGNAIERNRIMYVSITRPKSLLFLIN